MDGVWYVFIDIISFEKNVSFSIQKFKATHEGKVIKIFRSADPLGVCAENSCKSTEHGNAQGIGCCCNTELCNDSNTITISLNIYIAITFLIGINFILNYLF